MTPFINSVNKRTGLDLVSEVVGSANNLLAFGDNLQPFPGTVHDLYALHSFSTNDEGTFHKTPETLFLSSSFLMRT